FITRVFEPGGDFSINRFTKQISPFDSYVGFKVPWSDHRWQKMNTGEDHSFDVITLDEKGTPLSSKELTVKIYKLEWRYWWSSSYENLASYAGRTYHEPVYTTRVRTGSDGTGSFRVNIPKSRWGRYLVLADLPGGNTAGRVVYFDWPYGRTESAGGAEMLMVSTDREKYNVGDKVNVSFPAGKSSRALISIENGSKVLSQEWIDNIGENSVYSFVAERDMAPNVYVHVSLINPHSETANDLPVRMYGIAPVLVEDPGSHLDPVIDMPDKLRPEKEYEIKVSEKSGRAMDYYLAIVDEGLLDLTGFKTPDPWPAFYSKEALGVKTWDMYRFVLGAYGGELERMFAIGGDEEAIDPSKNQGRRFEPVVKVIGPFRLQEGKVARHSVMMPRYVGSVRAMLVAADGHAYGSAEKTVPVSNPVMVLGTMPRVLGPGEKIKIPVSVFAMEEGIDRIRVELETNELLVAEGPSSKVVETDKQGEFDIEFDYSVAGRTGQAVVNIIARSGSEEARHDIFIDVRNPNPPETGFLFKELEAGEKWNIEIEKTGVEGTNSARLEVSGILPLNLGKRLDYLIRYPHGCIEQLTSAVFPQLFIGSILEPEPARQEETEMNIKDGIQQLKRYQLTSGAMSFWPGSAYASDWGSVYAAHFILEAERAGYTVSPTVKNRLMQYIRTEAGAYSWDATKKYMQVTQAYRLYVLAEAGDPLAGAMNRLRERGSDLDMTALWFLAGSYALAGRTEVAYELIDLRNLVPGESYRQTFGTRERNMAVILNVLSILDEKEQAFRLARELSDVLLSERWLSTQTTAWSLVAITNFLGKQGAGDELDYSLTINGSRNNYRSSNAIDEYPLDYDDEGKINLEVENRGDNMIYATAVWRGTPMDYSTTSEQRGLDMSVIYLNREGREIDPRSVTQGSDFKAVVKVRNTSMYGAENIALSQVFPPGWEIMNTRLFEGGASEENSTYDYRDIRDDRVYTYFSLEPNRSKSFELSLTAAYEGEYTLPAVVCEDMYDNSFFARTAGMKVKVVKE
ncbi:MAG: alpha-2-macroglobulin family protein, partial [Bacteroidales bacterium]|nr:alpha-2-macroglobulin family protein [Bacteroidales bacterium]